jgi:hypothetical protein
MGYQASKRGGLVRLSMEEGAAAGEQGRVLLYGKGTTTARCKLTA